MPQVIFEQHRAQIYAWAYRLLQNHHDALDVTQEVFIKWWRANGTGSVPGKPLGWLRRVTVNAAIDADRSAARKSPPVQLAFTISWTLPCGSPDLPSARAAASSVSPSARPS